MKALKQIERMKKILENESISLYKEESEEKEALLHALETLELSYVLEYSNGLYQICLNETYQNESLMDDLERFPEEIEVITEDIPIIEDLDHFPEEVIAENASLESEMEEDRGKVPVKNGLLSGILFKKAASGLFSSKKEEDDLEPLEIGDEVEVYHHYRNMLPGKVYIVEIYPENHQAKIVSENGAIAIVDLLALRKLPS